MLWYHIFRLTDNRDLYSGKFWQQPKALASVYNTKQNAQQESLDVGTTQRDALCVYTYMRTIYIYICLCKLM